MWWGGPGLRVSRGRGAGKEQLPFISWSRMRTSKLSQKTFSIGLPGTVRCKADALGLAPG